MKQRPEKNKNDFLKTENQFFEEKKLTYFQLDWGWGGAREEDSNKVRNEKGGITSDSPETQEVIGDYYEQI